MRSLSLQKSYGGVQGVFTHSSEVCACEMTFAVYLPPLAEKQPCPVLWYLSGLTCTHQNVMEKGEYRRLAAMLCVIIVCPDKSPRGSSVPDEPENSEFGSGAGFYLDATEMPYATNYNMYTYLIDELPKLIEQKFPADMTRQGIFGHSMGGHGAITIALKNPDRFKSCSAFAPICRPTLSGWSRSAFQKYLGADESTWRQYDACELIRDGHKVNEIFVDQGTDDPFLSEGLRLNDLKQACSDAGLSLTLRMQEGYGHSYYFISSFMSDHLRWHSERLTS